MQLFINECSLHSQFSDMATFRQALETVVACTQTIQSDFDTCRSYYAEDNLYVFLALPDVSFWETFNKIADPGFKTRIRRVLFDALNIINWRTEQVHDSYGVYEYLSQDCSDTSMAEAAERRFCDDNDPIILINFRPSRFDELLSVTVLKDETHEITVDCATSVASVASWTQRVRQASPVYDLDSEGKPHDMQTVLADVARFQRTPYIYHHRRVYEELSTGNRLYVDNFHSGGAAHLEVFARSGRHLGIATLDGVLDASRVVPGREFRPD